jgi:hypothetical protein
VRRPAHESGRLRIHGQGQSWKSVSDKIHPEDLDWQKRQGKPSNVAKSMTNTSLMLHDRRKWTVFLMLS